MFRRKARPTFPDAEKVDLSPDDKIDWMLITGQLQRGRRRRLAWRLFTDLAVFVILGLAVWGLFTIIQHNAG